MPLDLTKLPALLTVLTDVLDNVEWVDTELYENEHGLACPWCAGLNPQGHYWPRHVRKRTLGHTRDCLRQRAVEMLAEAQHG